MTTQQSAQRPGTARVHVAPPIVAAIAAAAFMAGLGFARFAPVITPAQAPVVQAPATFDSAGFRSEERDSWHPAPTFDAVRFRAEERQP